RLEDSPTRRPTLPLSGATRRPPSSDVRSADGDSREIDGRRGRTLRQRSRRAPGPLRLNRATLGLDQRDVPGRDAAAGQRAGAAARGERKRVVALESGAERKGQAGGEAVAGPVCVDDLARRVGGGVRAAGPRPTAEAAGRR